MSTVGASRDDIKAVVLHHIAADAHRKSSPARRRRDAPRSGRTRHRPPLPQLKVTELEYPFTDIKVPLKVALPVTPAVWGELLMLIV